MQRQWLLPAQWEGAGSACRPQLSEGLSENGKPTGPADEPRGHFGQGSVEERLLCVGPGLPGRPSFLAGVLTSPTEKTRLRRSPPISE